MPRISGRDIPAPDIDVLSAEDIAYALHEYRPSPLGLQGAALAQWAAAMLACEGRCSCHGKNVCGKPHTKSKGRCEATHKPKQTLSLHAKHGMLCPACYRGADRLTVAAVETHTEGLF